MSRGRETGNGGVSGGGEGEGTRTSFCRLPKVPDDSPYTLPPPPSGPTIVPSSYLTIYIHTYVYIIYTYSVIVVLSRVHMAFVYRLNARRRRTSLGGHERRQVCILKLLPGALPSRRRRRRPPTHVTTFSVLPHRPHPSPVNTGSFFYTCLVCVFLSGIAEE